MTIESSSNHAVFGFAGNDTIDASNSTGDNYLYGGAGNDTIYGGEGNDVIFGGTGDDVIYGGMGSDTMTGGPGNDIFVYTSVWDSPYRPGHNPDFITDFVTGEDKLRFEGLEHGSFSYLGIAAFTGTGNSEARIEVESDKGVQLFVDTMGVGVADMLIVLEDVSVLYESDFDWA